MPPDAPPAPSNFRFTGQEGTPGQASPALGGNFSFDAPEVATYSITLDLNQDRIYGNVNDRTFVGTSVVGTNTVFWDGKDGNGIVAPASSSAYNIRISLLTGDVHFPFLDAENNPNGFIIERQTLPGPDSFTLYYNDTGLTGGTPPNPISALGGVDSSLGVHRFTGGFGDVKAIDSWTYVPSTPLLLSGGVTLASADLAISKTDNQTTINVGSPITYTITVTNNGPSNVTGATVSDSIPNTISGVSWTCAVTIGTSSCGAASGTGNAINTTVNLNNGAVATYTVTGILSPTASGTLSNTATVTKPNDVNDSNTANNTATDTTAIITSPNLLLVKRITAINGEPVVIKFQNGVNIPGDPNNVGTKEADDNDNILWPVDKDISLRGAIHSSTIPAVNLKPGDEVEYTIYFLNNGAARADNVSICDFVPANQTYIGTGYNSLTTADVGGLAGSNYGIAILSANGDTPVKATNAVDGDRGQFYTSNFPVACRGTPNGNGAVVVNMGSIPHATGSGTPASSYGFIRFKAKIN